MYKGPSFDMRLEEVQVMDSILWNMKHYIPCHASDIPSNRITVLGNLKFADRGGYSPSRKEKRWDTAGLE